jgi:pyoverdine/dityrosine biosynthesis protein Dit1
MNKFKTEDDVREAIEDNGYEDITIFSNPDYASAFIGISEDSRAVYNFDEMVRYLMVEYNITDIEAIEFIEFNTLRALPYAGSKAPIIVYDLD